MEIIENKQFPNERDLYGVKNVIVKNCAFDGTADGESALKETENVELENCYMNLRYPLWHGITIKMNGVTMTENCRAALWYTEGVKIQNSHLSGIKAVRECGDVFIENTEIKSAEFGWKSHDITLKRTKIESEYIFLDAKNIFIYDVDFKGKYSFQYVENATVKNSVLDTKDAFWHTKNVTVKNCTVKGEYLAWYSENLTLIDCQIIGTQPFCYCKNLKLINCTMKDTDLSFEYSDVNADIRGNILSVKNPANGKIVADKIDEIILTADSKYECNCEIIQNEN